MTKNVEKRKDKERENKKNRVKKERWSQNEELRR